MESINWTDRVDEALEQWEEITAREAGDRTGIAPHVIAEWRRRRRAGGEILVVQARYAEALERFLELGYETGRIPLGVRAQVRRPPRREGSARRKDR